jgi:hypothetical protein
MFSQGKTWMDFPYGLLDCPDLRSFSRKYEKFLLPVLLWFGKSTSRNESSFVAEKLKELSAEVGKDGRQLLIDNFSELVAYFLPTFVASVAAVTNFEGESQPSESHL